MKKSDLSIKNICIAAINRNTIAPFDFKFSKLYTGETPFEDSKILEALNLQEEEAIICSVIVSKIKWSVLTSRRIITWDKDQFYQQFLTNLISREKENHRENFKDKFSKGFYKSKEKQIVPVFIENGRASSIITSGIETVVKIGKG